MADQLKTRMFIRRCVGKSGGLGTNALGAVKETMSKDDITGYQLYYYSSMRVGCEARSEEAVVASEQAHLNGASFPH